MSDSELITRTCTPCKGGIPPLTPDEAARYLKEAPEWKLLNNATRIKRTFAFKTFMDALMFAQRVGELCESEGHHPDITFGWGYCRVEFQTHKIHGLHENDFIMAAKVDRLAGALQASKTHAPT